MAFPLACPTCGGAMRIIAFNTDAPNMRAFLAHLGEHSTPPSGHGARPSALKPSM